MQRSTPSVPGWFQGAPTSKLLAVSSITALAVFRNAPWTRSSSPLWNKWIFRPGSGESFVGTALFLYWSRSLERQTGSRKFVTILMVVQLLAMGFDFVLLETRMGKQQYMGPYSLLGFYAVWFHIFCPRVHPRFVQFLGITFSEKTIGYLLFAWVAAAEGRESIVPTVAGMLSWYGYRKFLEASFVIPEALVRWIAPYSERFLEAVPPVIPTVRMRVNRAINTQQRPVATPVARPVAPEQPPTAAVEQLVNMGFPRAQVIQALQSSNNSVERAADRLLSGS